MRNYKSKPFVDTTYPTIRAFAAAVLAYQNGQYDQTNKVHMRDSLDAGEEYSESVIDRAKEIMQFYQGLTFKVLSGAAMTDLNKTLMNAASSETVSARQLGAIAYSPKGYEYGKQRVDYEDRIRFATGELLQPIGGKFAGTVEVLRCIFSANYQVYFVTAVTEGDSIVYFAAKKSVAAGSRVSISGTIKAHRTDQTQLNRVKISAESVGV